MVSWLYAHAFDTHVVEYYYVMDDEGNEEW